MKPILSEHDKHCIKKLIELGMFINVMPEKLEIGKGIVIAPCSDGDQFDDVYSHIAGVCKHTVTANRIHTVALNGGGMLMSDNLRQEYNADGEAMLRSIIAAVEIKGINDVFLYTHFPCAIAIAHGLGVVDQGRFLMMAKRRLKEAAPSLDIKCFFHLDMYDEKEGSSHKKRTYFMPKEMWKNDESLLPVLNEFKNLLFKV